MTKIMELRKAIASELRAVHDAVYYEEASSKATYPYLVYDMPNSVDEGTLENIVLDVDGWDNPLNGDTTALEEMMDRADLALHRKTIYINSEVCVTFYREHRLTVRDDDKTIRRRKYIYQARTYPA